MVAARPWERARPIVYSALLEAAPCAWQAHFEQQQRIATIELREQLEAAEAKADELAKELKTVNGMYEQAERR